MRCSATVCFLTLMTWVAIGLYVGGGYAGLDQTLELFAVYGPVKGQGNPGLDDPPEMWRNPDTNKWEPVDANNPGNRVPQVFAGVQYFIIAWGVFMFINSIVLVIDSVRSRKAINDQQYRGDRTSDSSISCTAWLVGYCIFLALMWLVQTCFTVLPILEYRITRQRCWDLDNPAFSSATGDICVDFVQYGLVLFKDTNNEGYALMCGANGNYYPARGDLQGFCEAYYPTFVAFALALTGAGLGTLAMILYAVDLGSNFSYLKVRRHEGLAYASRPPNRSPRKTPSRGSRRSVSDRSQPYETPLKPGQPGYRYAYVPAAQGNGVSLYNPNYGSSIISPEPPKPVPEVMSFQPYHEEDDIEMHTLASEKEKALTYSDPDSDEPRRSHRDRYPPSDVRTPSPPPYDLGVGDYDRGDRRSDHSSSRHRHQHKRKHTRHGTGSNYDDMPSTDDNTSVEYTRREPSRSASRRSMRHRRRSESDDDNVSGRAASEEDYLSRASSRRHHRHKSSRRGSAAKLYEDDSPGSDFYETQDRIRSGKRY